MIESKPIIQQIEKTLFLLSMGSQLKKPAIIYYTVNLLLLLTMAISSSTMPNCLARILSSSLIFLETISL